MAPPNIHLTDDDIQIILEVYRNRIVDADGICGLLAHRSDAHIRRRLKALTEHKYLHKFNQHVFRKGGGRFSFRYGLGDHGARELNSIHELGLNIPATRWATRNHELAAGTVKHTLEQTKFMLQTRGSVSLRDDISFHYPHEIYHQFKPKLLEARVLPQTIYADVDWFGHKQKEGTKFDLFFNLHYSKNEIGKQNRFLFVEIDIGKETINPTDRVMRSSAFWNGSSLMRKWVVYGNAFAQRSHLETFGIPTFQVLHVTKNPARVAEMIEAYNNRLTNGQLVVAPSRLLFTDFETVRKHRGDILQIPILNGAGKILTLG